jgi:hypothetical protein
MNIAPGASPSPFELVDDFPHAGIGEIADELNVNHNLPPNAAVHRDIGELR